MKKITLNNCIEKGLIISTTGFPRNSQTKDIILPWNKGSEKIVGMLEKVITKTPTQKIFSQQTPFVPQYVFTMSDEQSLFDKNRMPLKLWYAAQDYDDWILNHCTGQAPDFKDVVDTFCSGRLCLFIGLGGYIFCELDSDAKALATYYQN